MNPATRGLGDLYRKYPIMKEGVQGSRIAGLISKRGISLCLSSHFIVSCRSALSLDTSFKSMCRQGAVVIHINIVIYSLYALKKEWSNTEILCLKPAVVVV